MGASKSTSDGRTSTPKKPRTAGKPDRFGYHTKMDEKGKKLFIDTLAERANVSDACRAVGISRKRAYDLRKKDEQFKEDWAAAMEDAVDKLHDEAWRRGADGVDEPVFYQGEEVGAIRKYSDRMLEALLRAHSPQFRQGTAGVSVESVAGEDGAPGQIKITFVKADGADEQDRDE